MSRSLREAIEAGFRYLQAVDEPPGMEARDDSGRRVFCPALPYAVALYAFSMRRLQALGSPDAPISAWLKRCCDSDGMVRFYGPQAPIIGPDIDDTALLWSERSAYTGLAPPEAVEEALAQSRSSSGVYNTWPSPPEDGPALEEDPAVNVNVLSLLASLGREDEETEAYVVSRLEALDRGEEVRCPYYPDTTILLILAHRAQRLGGLSSGVKVSATSSGLWGDIAQVLMTGDAEALARVLIAQDADGSWPWAPLFVGGHDNHFPDGSRMARPLFGDAIVTTALALFALAEVANLPWSPRPEITGQARARRRREEAWESMVGPLSGHVSLESEELASTPRPRLVGPDGTLELEVGPKHPDKRFYRGSASWTVSYRGERPPSAREEAAIEALLTRLEAHGPPKPKQVGPSRVYSEAADAGDLPALLEHIDRDDGPVHVRLSTSLNLSHATRAIATALGRAGRDGPELRFEGIPHCALPWPEELVMSAPADSKKRAPRAACQTCTEQHHCAGPMDAPLRRRTATQPWTPVDRFARAWSQSYGYPGAEAWRGFFDALNRLPTGPLSGIRWSIVGVIDVVNGAVDPAFRLDVFHGHRDGEKLPGHVMLSHLKHLTDFEGCITDSERQRDLLSVMAERCPIYPALYDGPRGRAVPCYAETAHLSAEHAWGAARALCQRAGLEAPLWPRPLPRLLGVSVACNTGTAPDIDLYVIISRAQQHRFKLPDELQTLRGPGPVIGTYRLSEGGALSLRKWDVAWWSAGHDDQALTDALGASRADAEAIQALLSHDGFGLHPTTLGWRDGGRRIYLRVV